MAQRKKKLTKKKRHQAREPESESDGDFELAAEVKDDESVRTEYFLLFLKIQTIVVTFKSHKFEKIEMTVYVAY